MKSLKIGHLFIISTAIVLGLVAVFGFKKHQSLALGTDTNNTAVLTQTARQPVNNISQKPTAAVPLNKQDKVLSPLQKMIQTEALHLYDKVEDAQAAEEKIKDRAAQLTPAEIQELTEIALDEGANKDERTVAVYYLKLSGAPAHESLLKIFSSPSQALTTYAPAHSFAEANKVFEYSLRSMALEGVENNLFEYGNAPLSSVTLPKSLLQTQKDTYLKGLLRIVFVGKQMGRPMLKEFIDKNLEEAQL